MTICKKCKNGQLLAEIDFESSRRIRGYVCSNTRCCAEYDAKKNPKKEV